MTSFDDLLKVAKVLNSPEGCAWDRKQTFKSLQPYVLEEAHEVVDAVDAGDDHKIVEELGDLLYQVVFYAEIAEKEGHHPDILLSWGKVKITLWTHKIDGLTESDFILAAKCDLVD